MTAIDPRDWTSEYYAYNESVCKISLEDTDSLRKIPSLNCASLDDFKHGQLVRFCGMIQDMYDPEYYFRDYLVKNNDTGESWIRCGMYKDSAACLNEKNETIDVDSERTAISERQTWIVVSIPGLNDWAKEKITPRTKEYQSLCGSAVKRELCEEELMDCSEPSRKREKSTNVGEKFNTVVKNRTHLSRDHILNFPIPIDDGKACIVKIYDEKISCKLNDIVDIVGFVSLDPMLGNIENSEDTIDDPEIQTHNPPVSLVPRLHAIKIIEETTNLSNNPMISTIMTKAEIIRSDLRMVLSQLMFGDKLAADYLICHLISSVYTRKDHLCLGSFPINITNFPISKYPKFTKDLYRVISTLVPKSHNLEFTLENLNDMNLIPKKDYECNRLTSGILQLSKNTHLVIDETGLTSGSISASGKKNYEAMRDMIQFQKVTYDFKYFTMEYETDIPVLILSEGKSLIPCVTQIALKIDNQTEYLYPSVVEAASQYLRDEERLSNIRDYLRSMRHADFQFGEEISDVIQEDFVKLRQSQKNFGADNLHSLMVMARLVSLSRGKNFLSHECWRETIENELERIDRLPKRKT